MEKKNLKKNLTDALLKATGSRFSDILFVGAIEGKNQGAAFFNGNAWKLCDVLSDAIVKNPTPFPDEKAMETFFAMFLGACAEAAHRTGRRKMFIDTYENIMEACARAMVEQYAKGGNLP